MTSQPITPDCGVDEDSSDSRRKIFAKRITIIVVALGTIFLIASLSLGLGIGNTASQSTSIVVGSFMVSGASAGIGALIGFTFAIPRATLSGHSLNGMGADYTANTNFEQISDWLTKILVGVSLVQVGRLPAAVGSLGRTLAPIFGNRDSSAGIGVAMCVSALLCGFLVAYVWTRVLLPSTFRLADITEAVKSIKDSVQRDKEHDDALDAMALSLVQRQLDGTNPPSQSELTEAFEKASMPILVQAYSRADDQRRRAWRQKRAEDVMRTIPVFRALIACDPDEKFQAYRGSLGYALFESDPPDLQGAIDQLDAAIRISGSPQINEMYRYIRAACLIELQRKDSTAPPSDEAIWADLQAAKPLGQSYFERIDEDPDKDAPAKIAVRQWLAEKDKNFNDL